ncbi:MAG: radical SAM protein [Gammaproteobacteria bacterium]|nr:radical SAM protein [Gammaproteobacteria bacterium]
MSHAPIALVALHAGYSHSSLALQSIAAYSSGEDYFPNLHILESLVNKNQQVLLEQLVELQPAIIGFSTYLWNIDTCLHLAELLDQLLPNSHMVLGGPEAGPRGEELLTEHAAVDYVIDGEGEAAFRDLVHWLIDGQGSIDEISGLVYWNSDRIRRNSIRVLEPESIPSALTSGLMVFDKPLVYWETSRGCPYKCTFCTSATDRLRVFSMERVDADLALIQNLPDKVVKLLDRSFHLGRQRTVQLLERFAATPDGLRFHLELNPDRISEEAMEIFRRASPGKFQFEIGLQTLSEPVLDAVERRMQIPLALQNIRELVEMNRHPVHLDLIVGLPGENAASCRDSLDLAFGLHAEHLQLGTLKLLPGTPLLEQAQRLGYRWDRRPPYEVIAHPLLDFQEIARFKRYAQLLDRLWNSGYLTATLMWLIPKHFGGRLSHFFDAFIQQMGQGAARDKLQPDSLYGLICKFLASRLVEDKVLNELLLWDYSRFSLVNTKTPGWIAEHLRQSVTLPVAGSRRRLPLLTLSVAAVKIINQRRRKPLQAGQYAVWPRQHKKGKPVEIIQVAQPVS